MAPASWQGKRCGQTGTDRNKTGEAQALANGALAQSGNIGNLVGTPLLLAVACASGINAGTAIVVVFYLFAIAAHALMWRTLHQLTDVFFQGA